MEWLCPAEKNRWSKEATPACLRIGPRVGRQGLHGFRELPRNPYLVSSLRDSLSSYNLCGSPLCLFFSRGLHGLPRIIF